MTSQSIKPKVVISRCLGFGNCRYNGKIISDPFFDQLEKIVDCHPVCPEMEIGLGMPRDPIQIVMEKGAPRLIQLVTDRDVTDAMQKFTSQFLNSLQAVDGFILKSRSPSCGMGDVDIFADREETTPLKMGNGFFCSAVLERFKELAIEDEEGLKDLTIREHFLTRLFTSARLRLE